MSVAFTSSAPSGSPASGKNGTAASFTFTSFAVSGANPVVLVKVAMRTVSASVQSMACSAGLTGTPALVKSIVNNQGGDGVTVEIWAIPAPSGTGTITVTLTASVAYQAIAELYANADQSTPCPTGDAVTVTGVANPLTLTPSNMTANDASSGFGANGPGDDPTYAGTAQTYKDNTTNVNAAGGYVLGTGASTVTYGIPDSADAFVAVRIVAAAGGGGGDLSVGPSQIGEPVVGGSTF